jgi:flagellar hook-associated protein 3 FlgL
MTSFGSISTTRVSNLQLQHNLLSQLQFDQSALLRLQTQLSSGRRIAVPSEDAPAANRAIDLQRLLERKTQVKSNLSSNAAYLNATDSTAAAASQLAVEAKAIALSAIDGGTSQAGRAAAASQIDAILGQIMNLGNQQFRGRQLFAGTSATTAPYALVNGAVRYSGDDGGIYSYSDLGMLFQTNVTGHESLGGLSAPVRGQADLDRRLTADTRLVDLRGGQGVGRGSVSLSDGSTTVVIDMSGAQTIGDVARLLESAAFPGRAITAEVTSRGLRVSLSGAGANLTIKEVGSGTTAHELGIFASTGVGNGPIIGEDLDPRITRTTSLDQIMGTRAQASIAFDGGNNDILFEAQSRGAAFNDVTILLVDGGPGAAGNETAVYDDSNPANKTLTITIADGASTANQVIAAVQSQTPFTARLDPREAANNGQGVVRATSVDPQATAVTAGGDGIDFDPSGLRIVNGGRTYTIDLATARTIEDVLNLLNGSGADILAEINPSGTGLDIRSRLSGADFAIGENGGQTATQLGLRTLTTGTRLTELGHGQGIHDTPGVDFQIRRKDGTLIDVDLAGAETIGDVLERINASPANPADAWQVTARLATFGNGIELSTSDQPGLTMLGVLAQGTPAATQLGLIPSGSTTSDAPILSGGSEFLTGRDTNPREGQGVVHALARLRDAILANDRPAIERATSQLDLGLEATNFARAELGARQQTIDSLQIRLEDEEVELRRILSIDLDADLVQVISEFTARQSAYQASLQLIGRTSQLSLLDFL